MIFSNTEFYYTPPELISDKAIIIADVEAKHISRVMRHKVDDIILITNGEGKIYQSVIKNITKSEVIAESQKVFKQDNKLRNVTFCIPILKSSDRFEFALEKCVELGITNFLVFSAKKSYKRGVKLERWDKILLSAMKQSLQSHKPKIDVTHSLSQTLAQESNKIYFEQNSELLIENYFNEKNNSKLLVDERIFFVFGPEGGLTDEELNSDKKNIQLKLTSNRLRSETAIMHTASLLNKYLESF
ncbi:MAG: 16S rRNA (uracil(1498)-N(3))-methyltransferase [Ignavibacteriae bacterium]|nr:16S rRNA (uracil(1498)-N(3))-methyltransferase [Ignavibacteriota bacterium]